MRRFCVIAGQASCITAALFVALSPVFSGLHLASCNHEHAPCSTHPLEHAHCAHCCCQSDMHDSDGSGSFRTLVSGSQNKRGQGHDPATCPICQTFAQLMQGAQVVSPPLATLTSPETHLPVLCPDRNIPSKPCFSICFPRAPPAG